MGSKNKAMEELRYNAIEALKEMIEYQDCINGDEIHQRLFNEDYYIIGRYEAEQWLSNTAEGIFNCIETIKEYEQDNFGEVSTDLSEPENVVNMYVYILGEEILQDVDNNKHYDKEELQELIEEIENAK